MPRPLSQKKQKALILRAAADLIDKGSLCKSVFNKTLANGKVAYCMSGALRKATDLNYDKLPTLFVASGAEKDLLKELNGAGFEGSSIMNINDKRKFRKTDALTYMRATADKLDPPKEISE